MIINKQKHETRRKSNEADWSFHPVLFTYQMLTSTITTAKLKWPTTAWKPLVNTVKHPGILTQSLNAFQADLLDV